MVTISTPARSGVEGSGTLTLTGQTSDVTSMKTGNDRGIAKTLVTLRSTLLLIQEPLEAGGRSERSPNTRLPVGDIQPLLSDSCRKRDTTPTLMASCSITVV